MPGLHGKLGSLITWAVDPMPIVGLGGGAVATAGQINLSGWYRIQGEVRQDVAGVLVINFRASPTAAPVMTYIVPQDVAQPNFVYSYNIVMLAPYVQIVFTNGGAASAYFQARNEAFAT